MLFQLISDLHLEFYKGKFPKINKVAENLILAGDIGLISDINNLKGFLKQVCKRWNNIYYVLGNHEYYECIDMKCSLDKLKKSTQELNNLHILDNEYIILDGIAIYGFTGWTIPSDKIRRNISYLCDFDQIYIDGKNITANNIEFIARKELDKFKEFINSVNSNEIECNSVIVITHFPLIREGTSDPKYIGNVLNDYFTWINMFISENIVCDKIKVCCSGHTHWSYEFTINDIKFISNQYGYPNEGVEHSNGQFEIP
jgi:predicted phosphohydrolase